MTWAPRNVFRVLAGLPSRNEAGTIATVTADLDAAIATLPFPAEALLVNADNASTDGTPGIFLATATMSPKHVITTDPAAGKGASTLALLKFGCDQGFDAIICVDTDLAAVPASWIHALLGAIHAGAGVCYPLRPPAWNGADLTYHLAYPVLVAVFGADLREPLCGDIAISRSAAQRIIAEPWTARELRYGGDFLIAALAAVQSWNAVTLTRKRRNKLRSFAVAPGGDYRMGQKFADNALTVQRRAAFRLRQEPPAELMPSPGQTPGEPGTAVPAGDPDIALLAKSTARQLREDAREGAFTVFPAPLAKRLENHATSGEAGLGLPWPAWRDCLVAWISDYGTPASRAIPVELLETLFLNRVVGHHAEITGTLGWYSTVCEQARDLFARRHELWRGRNISSGPDNTPARHPVRVESIPPCHSPGRPVGGSPC
jgi:hypothetical protein